jgi:hypothetical protein
LQEKSASLSEAARPAAAQSIDVGRKKSAMVIADQETEGVLSTRPIAPGKPLERERI